MNLITFWENKERARIGTPRAEITSEVLSFILCVSLSILCTQHTGTDNATHIPLITKHTAIPVITIVQSLYCDYISIAASKNAIKTNCV